MKYGTTFSTKYCAELEINWEEAYKQILDDYNFHSIRLCAYWDLLEPKQGEFDFSDLDKQIKLASEKGVEITLAMGRKVPRWPEFHEPKWLSQNLDERNDALFKYIETVINRYKDEKHIKYWQIENEPFWGFGESEFKIDRNTVKQEVELVRSLDNRKITITDSGGGNWRNSSKLADKFGVNVYTKLYEWNIKAYIPVPTHLYRFQFFSFFSRKEIFISELQAEPWGPKYIASQLSVEEANKTMNPKRLEENIELAKRLGVGETWLWGAEWWYYEKLNGREEMVEKVRGMVNETTPQPPPQTPLPNS